MIATKMYEKVIPDACWWCDSELVASVSSKPRLRPAMEKVHGQGKQSGRGPQEA